MKFEFITEDGVFTLDYADYCARQDLIERVHDGVGYTFLNLGLKLLLFNNRWLKDHPKQRRFVEHMKIEYAANPLRYFLPHCARHATFDTPAHNYVNNDADIFAAMVSPNRWGKTTLTWIAMLIRAGLIPCDKDWEVFKDHGVRYREFTDPVEIGVISYMWDNHRKTLWPQIMRVWTPKDALGEWAAWNVPVNTSGAILTLPCKSKIHIMCCRQPQQAFESAVLDDAMWDEQGVEDRFAGCDARLKTRREIVTQDDGFEHILRGMHRSGLTPHRVPDRPDTGAGTWLHDMIIGKTTRGLTVKSYTGSLIEDVPDWCYSERQKERDLAELHEAEEHNDKKRMRSIRSRIFGEWEVTGGLVYDEFDEEVHVIDDLRPRPDWCAYRMGDHGRTNPSAWLWAAVTPDQDIIIFDEYEHGDRTISHNVEAIIAQSGNECVEVDPMTVGHNIVRRFEERQTSSKFVCDWIDGRSFLNPDTDSTMSIGDIYKRCGLTRLRGAPIQQIEQGVDLVKELLRIRYDRNHIQTGAKGAPRLYICRKCVRLIACINRYRNKPVTQDGVQSEKPHAKNDHLVDALRYGIIARISYNPARTFGNQMEVQDDEQPQSRGYWCPEDRLEPPKVARSTRRRRSSVTGY